MTEKPRKIEYLENEKSFQVEIESIFDYFKKAFSCQKYCRPEIALLHFYFLFSLDICSYSLFRVEIYLCIDILFGNSY